MTKRDWIGVFWGGGRELTWWLVIQELVLTVGGSL
jgi:hypothetical protein